LVYHKRIYVAMLFELVAHGNPFLPTLF
jgi:hypothetical protein